MKELAIQTYLRSGKTLTDLKKKKDFEWLKEVNSQSLQATLKHLDSAYKMFFRKTHQFPNFKLGLNPSQIMILYE